MSDEDIRKLIDLMAVATSVGLACDIHMKQLQETYHLSLKHRDQLQESISTLCYFPHRAVVDTVGADGTYGTHPVHESIIFRALQGFYLLPLLAGRHIPPTSRFCGLRKPVSRAPETVASLLTRLNSAVDLTAFYVTSSPAAVDITPHGVNKGYGLERLSAVTGVPLESILCIGDAVNDLSMLTIAGYAACPANAAQDVKNCVSYISPFSYTEGVLDILQHFFGM